MSKDMTLTACVSYTSCPVDMWPYYNMLMGCNVIAITPVEVVHLQSHFLLLYFYSTYNKCIKTSWC